MLIKFNYLPKIFIIIIKYIINIKVRYITVVN